MMQFPLRYLAEENQGMNLGKNLKSGTGLLGYWKFVNLLCTMDSSMPVYCGSKTTFCRGDCWPILLLQHMSAGLNIQDPWAFSQVFASMYPLGSTLNPLLQPFTTPPMLPI